jgi:hypothetical protein
VVAQRQAVQAQMATAAGSLDGSGDAGWRAFDSLSRRHAELDAEARCAESRRAPLHQSVVELMSMEGYVRAARLERVDALALQAIPPVPASPPPPLCGLRSLGARMWHHHAA